MAPVGPHCASLNCPETLKNLVRGKLPLVIHAKLLPGSVHWTLKTES